MGLSAQVQAESPEPVDVLVVFYQPPGPDEAELIEGLGGTVRDVYYIVPTIAATIPLDKLDELKAAPRVELVHPFNKGTGVKVAVLDTGIDLTKPLDCCLGGRSKNEVLVRRPQSGVE